MRRTYIDIEVVTTHAKSTTGRSSEGMMSDPEPHKMQTLLRPDLEAYKSAAVV